MASKNNLQQGEISESQKNKISIEANNKIQNFDENNNSDSLLKEIGQLYLQGAFINWSLIYDVKERKKVSLPTYQFEKNRCWVDFKQKSVKKDTIENQKQIHPLIHRLLVSSMDQDIYQTIFSSDTHWVLKDHIIMGKHVIPGTTYLEMARVAVQNILKTNLLELSDILFYTPIILKTSETREVHTIINKQGEYFHFKIVSKNDETDEWIKHVEGKIKKTSTKEIHFDIDQLKKECNEKIIDINQNKITFGWIEFGPRWLNYHKIRVGKKTALSELKLPEEFESDLNDYYIHPSLLDMAVAGDGLLAKDRFLPFSYRKFILYSQMPAEFYSYIVRDKENIDDEEAFTQDVFLVDVNGKSFAEVKGFSAKKVKDFSKFNQEQQNYYEINWKENPLIKNSVVQGDGKILCFIGENQLAKDLVLKLKEKGNNIITIKQGEQYNKISKSDYEIENNLNSYQLLFQDLKSEEVTEILYLNALDNNENIENINELKRSQKNGVYSFFSLIKVLASRKNSVNISILTRYSYAVTGDESLILPQNASLIGLSKVVPNEYSQINCKCIDIDHNVAISEILNEMNSDIKINIVAYRGKKRYTEVFSKLNVEKSEDSGIQLTDSSVYIITGGLGGIGLEFTKYLSTLKDVKIILWDQIQLPEVKNWSISGQDIDEKLSLKIKILEDCYKNGAKIEYINIDITNYEEVQKTVKNIQQKYQKINGIIHAAGMAGDGFIINKDETVLNNVLSPKIYGTWNLNKATETMNLDFFVLFSSVETLIARAGQSDYVAANSYLDAFSQYRSLNHKGSFTINWVVWKETGMAANFGVNVDELFKAIYTQNALQSFSKVLTKKINRVFIGDLDLNYLIQAKKDFPIELSEDLSQKLIRNQKNIKKESHSDSGTVDYDVRVIGKTSDDYTEVEKNMARIWAKALGLTEIDIYDSFDDLGGDSILATRLLAELENAYPSMINIVDIFTYRTVFHLSEYISVQINPEKEDKEEDFDNIENPEEKIKEILAKIKTGEIDFDKGLQMVNQLKKQQGLKK